MAVLGVWIVKFGRFGFGISKSIGRRGTGEVKIDSGIFRHAKIFVRSGVLHLVKSFTKQSIVRFFAIEQKINGFPDFFVVDLPI